MADTLRRDRPAQYDGRRSRRQRRPSVGDGASEAADADVILLPEMTITGYPPEDLVLKPGFVADTRAALEKFAAGTGRTAAVVGFADGDDSDVWRSVERSAVCAGGKIHGTYHKRHLPNYDVFDEVRHFRAGDEPLPLFEIRPACRSASPSVRTPGSPTGRSPATRPGWCAHRGQRERITVPHRKQELREQVIRHRVEESGVPVVYANLVGGQDELVFDGGSFVVAIG